MRSSSEGVSIEGSFASASMESPPAVTVARRDQRNNDCPLAENRPRFNRAFGRLWAVQEVKSGMPKPTDTPRAELHTHLGAAVDPPILWSIAHRQGIRLPTK